MSDFEPLTTLMASGPMPLEEVLRIGRDAAAALTGVHGELWPSAFHVSPDGVTVTPPCGTDRSRYGQYAAPERILGQPATAESDVFSLGAILFHALVGHPPFRGDTPSEVMLAVCADAPLELRAFRADAPCEVESVLTRSLARDPRKRYASASMFAKALHDAAPCAKSWPGRRVLIAEEDAPVRELEAMVMKGVGVEADIVAGGRDAIAALKSQRYDVALLDLNMTRLSGWEVLDFLRPRPELRPPRIFAVTGFAGQVISEADRDLVTAVLHKPLIADELGKLISTCLAGETLVMSAR